MLEHVLNFLLEHDRAHHEMKDTESHKTCKWQEYERAEMEYKHTRGVYSIINEHCD